MATSDERADQLLQMYEQQTQDMPNLEPILEPAVPSIRAVSSVPLADSWGKPVVPKPAQANGAAEPHFPKKTKTPKDPSKVKKTKRVQIAEAIAADTRSPAEVNSGIAGQIAAYQAEDTVRKARASIPPAPESQAKFEKRAAEAEGEAAEKQSLCNKNNAYRDKYEGKIVFVFKPAYYPDKHSLQWLRAENAAIKSKVDQIGLKPYILDGINGFIQAIDLFCLQINVTLFPALTDFGREAREGGVFEDSVEQIMIEHEEYFHVDAKWKLAFDISKVFRASFEHGRKQRAMGITDKMRAEYDDL